MKIQDIIPKYLKQLLVMGRATYTIRNTKYALRDFMKFLDSEGVEKIELLTREVMEEYQSDLAFRITDKGKLLSTRTQAQLLGVVKGFTQYLKEHDYLVRDPAEKIKLPKKPKKLPKVILNNEELRKLMDAPDMRTNQGYRNRIVLELLYDTGIRRAEVANIKLSDIDLDGGYIHIKGKGDKERVVPVCERVCTLVQSYIQMIRPAFIKNKDGGHLILNRFGKKMSDKGIWEAVKQCVSLANIKKNISTHTFRHTCATHLLKNGAPIRHVQELLGHESLESTQIYTHVTINDLKEIHAKYHPSETKLKKR